MSNLLAQLVHRVTELERRLNNTVVNGSVAEVDPARQMVRIDDGKKIGPWVSYAAAGGAIKMTSPPVKGQAMTMFSPMGEIGAQSVAMNAGFNDANPSPSGRGDANVITFGSFTVTFEGAALIIEAGGTTYKFGTGGFEQTGGFIKHNGTVIDDTHTHSGITAGPSRTGDPK